MPSYTGYIVETLVTLLAVCALAFAVLWGARRLGVGRPNGPIELHGHLPLDARRAIYLVKVGAQIFIVGVGEGGFTKLGEMPASELPPPSPTRASPFAAVLARAWRSEGSDVEHEASRTPERSEGSDEQLRIDERPSSERGPWRRGQ